MKVIFVGVKNFSFFSKKLLDGFEKIVLTSRGYNLPEYIANTSTIIRVDEVFDKDSKTYKLNFDQCMKEIKSVVNSFNDCRVFCNQEANLEIAEKLRSHFYIFDHMKGRVGLFRDKLLMKEHIAKSKLRVPLFTSLSKRINSYGELTKELGGDFIIKPSSSVGSRGVYKVFNENDYVGFIEDSKDDTCHFEAEEFIYGDLYEFDTAIQSGKLLYSNVSKYSCPMADLQDGTTLGSIMVGRDESLHQRISQFGSRCLEALGASDGCFHMEIFHNEKDELVFLEVAARSPGLMTVPAYQRWEGVNMYDLELLIQSGLPALEFSRSSCGHVSRPSFFVIYPKIMGKVVQINVPDINASIDIDWQVKPGDIVSDTTTNIDYAARFFVTCEEVSEAARIFQWLTSEFKAVTYA